MPAFFYKDPVTGEFVEFPIGGAGTPGQTGPQGPAGQAATLEITGADSLPYGSAPTVTEEDGSTAQARKYKLGIPEGKPGENGEGGGNVDVSVEWKTKTFVLEEDVDSVTIEIEDATEVHVISIVCVTNADGLNTGSTPLMMNVNNCPAARPDIYIRQNAKFRHVLACKKIDTRIFAFVTDVWGEGTTFANRKPMQLCGDDRTKNEKSKTIKSIKYYLADATLFLKSGSEWMVWYR